MQPWGRARKRKLRNGPNDVVLQPRRSRCRVCLITHVLLSSLALLRRRDLAEVIGEALLRRALGIGQRRVAGEVGTPFSTLRGWTTRFAERSELIRSLFTRLAVSVGANVNELLPAANPFADAVVAIQVAHQATVLRLGPVDLWASPPRPPAVC